MAKTSSLRRRHRAWVVVAALGLSAGAAQAGLLGDILGIVTGLLTPQQEYVQERNIHRSTSNALMCRHAHRHQGIEAQSYGDGSPRQRELRNACAPDL